MRAAWLVLVCAATVACADRDLAHACTARGATAPCTRVLFIGNSYTFTRRFGN